MMQRLVVVRAWQASRDRKALKDTFIHQLHELLQGLHPIKLLAHCLRDSLLRHTCADWSTAERGCVLLPSLLLQNMQMPLLLQFQPSLLVKQS